jgi:hypothetical protein
MAIDVHRIPDGNYRNGCESADHRDHGGRDVERLIHVRGRQIFFKDELDSIREGLKQPERAYSRWSPPVLHVTHNFPLKPYRVGDRRQQHEDRDHDLDHGRNQKCLDA